MNAPRFSLRMLLVAMTYIAVVLIAFISGSAEWSDTVYSISIGVMLVATVAAVFLNESGRTFWRGFCLVGWIYMFLAFGPFTANNVREHLLTHRILMGCQRVLALATI